MFAIIANLQGKLNKKSKEHERERSNNDDVMEVGGEWKGKEVETTEDILKKKNT